LFTFLKECRLPRLVKYVQEVRVCDHLELVRITGHNPRNYFVIGLTITGRKLYNLKMASQKIKNNLQQHQH
jgi:hypothetical protein